jgi:hypothetical protein
MKAPDPAPNPSPFRPDDPALHGALRSLPSPKAPRSLAPSVLAAIQAKAARPWWQRPLLEWPIAFRSVALASLASLAVAIFYSIGLAGNFTGGFEAFSSFSRVGSNLVTAGWNSVPSFWIWIGGSMLAASYALLLGLGTVVYRIAHSPLSSR